MNGYELTAKFRRVRKKYSFSNIEADLFYELVAICNDEEWPNTFQYPNALLCATIGVSEKSLIAARNRLQQASLVEFISGHKRHPTTYSFKIGLLKVSKNDSINGSKNGSKSGSITGEKGSDSFKGKLKGKENIHIHLSDSEKYIKAMEADITFLTDEELEAWDSFKAWFIGENFKAITKLQEPLTLRELFNLRKDYGGDQIRDTLTAMENYKPLLKNYTSTYRTLNNWLKKRNAA